MTRNNFFSIILIFALSSGAWWFLSRPDEVLPVPPDAVVVAFGDSLVVGVGAGPAENFVSVLSGRLGIPIVNAGQSGDTTASGLARLDKAVLAKNPDVVIVLLGGNDALRRVPEEETFRNLSLIVDRIEQRGARVLLHGVRGGLLGGGYKENFKKLAEEKKVTLVPDVLSGLFTDKRYMYDSVHPNSAGYARIADRVEPELRKLLQEQ